MFRFPILLLVALSAAATARAEPPLTAHVRHIKEVRGYRYVYYPEQQLYYSTEQQIWFWMNGNSWSYGVHLPAHFRSRMGTGLPLRLATTRPFIEHDHVERRYGRPWREKHGHPGAEADNEAKPGTRTGTREVRGTEKG